MLLKEFKEFLKELDRESLEGVAALLYKRETKAGKEYADRAIEDYLMELKEKREEKEKPKPKKEELPFEELKAQVEEFVADAVAYNYMLPNDKIPPREQTKWKSTAKAFFKALEAVPGDGENASEALRLYRRLLILMNDCNTGEQNRFPTKYAWRALRLSQREALKTLTGMYFAMDAPSLEDLALVINTMADCEESAYDEDGFSKDVLDACEEHGILNLLIKAGKSEAQRLSQLSEEKQSSFLGYIYKEQARFVDLVVQEARKRKKATTATTS